MCKKISEKDAKKICCRNRDFCICTNREKRLKISYFEVSKKLKNNIIGVKYEVCLVL